MTTKMPASFPPYPLPPASPTIPYWMNMVKNSLNEAQECLQKFNCISEKGQKDNTNSEAAGHRTIELVSNSSELESS